VVSGLSTALLLAILGRSSIALRTAGKARHYLLSYAQPRLVWEVLSWSPADRRTITEIVAHDMGRMTVGERHPIPVIRGG